MHVCIYVCDREHISPSDLHQDLVTERGICECRG